MGSQSEFHLPKSLRYYTTGCTKMKIVLPILLAVYLMATREAEAGCNHLGCCYCGSQDGLVIYTGYYRPRCNRGCYCQCGYNSYDRTYYGFCSNGYDDTNGNNVPRRPGGK